MNRTPPESLVPFHVVPTTRYGYVQLVISLLFLNELIALPVALSMASVNGAFVRDFAIASIYAQMIGTLCVVGSLASIEWIDSLNPGPRVAAIFGQYFAAGAAGAEIARRMSGWIWTDVTGDPLASVAVGATVAVIVGAVLFTIRGLRTRLVSTELEALQARINPHFLFNTLNSIAALIREDPARAETVTLHLSALFRYTLQAPRQGLVTLGDEIAIVEGYLGIERERFANRLTYTIEIDPALLEIRVPALILQPLVENAIKHGVSMSVAGGSVDVRGSVEHGDRLCLSVTNTGDGVSTNQGTGEGLVSVRRRLRATFGHDAEVTLTTAQGQTEARISFRRLAPSKIAEART